MKLLGILLSIVLGSSSLALAQGSGSSGSGAAANPGETGSTGTIKGTGGSPGSNVLGRRTTGNNLRANQPDTAAGSPPYSSPAADAAISKLGNTDTGILKK